MLQRYSFRINQPSETRIIFCVFLKIILIMDKCSMLEEMIIYYAEGNKSLFSRKLGVKPQTINTWLNRKTFDAELIYSKCEYISGDWLLSGVGEMINQQIRKK